MLDSEKSPRRQIELCLECQASRHSNARVAASPIRRQSMNPPAADNPMSKIARYAANLTYSGSNTILRSKNL
jgi:hypothetical protein